MTALGARRRWRDGVRRFSRSPAFPSHGPARGRRSSPSHALQTRATSAPRTPQRGGAARTSWSDADEWVCGLPCTFSGGADSTAAHRQDKDVTESPAPQARALQDRSARPSWHSPPFGSVTRRRGYPKPQSGVGLEIPTRWRSARFRTRCERQRHGTAMSVPINTGRFMRGIARRGASRRGFAHAAVARALTITCERRP